MLANRLLKLRKEKDMTQQEVSDAISIARPTYAQYEIGRREPDYATLGRLSKFFDCSTDFLLGLSDHKKPVIVDLAAHRKDDNYDKPLSEETHRRIQDFVQFVDRTFGIKASGADQDEETNNDSRETRD